MPPITDPEVTAIEERATAKLDPNGNPIRIGDYVRERFGSIYRRWRVLEFRATDDAIRIEWRSDPYHFAYWAFAHELDAAPFAAALAARAEGDGK